MKIIIQQVRQELLALQRELDQHPLLRAELEEMDLDFSQSLAHIATHCNILLDGYYSEDRLYYVCEQLTEALHKKRGFIILLDQPRGIM